MLNGRLDTKVKQARSSCKCFESIKLADLRFFLLMRFLLFSRLYNESKSLHASHDASLLKCDDDGYERKNELSQTILIRLQAGAFESLCEHLRARSDLVPNMELMTISGFCRNCLAKVSCMVDILNTEGILVTF